MCGCKLLCVGRDVQLVESRVQILSVHFSARAVNSAGGLKTLGEEFDVVLLCHSLEGEERSAATHYVRKRWPSAKLLQIVKAGRTQESDGADAEVGGIAGPRALLRSVEELLSRKPDHALRKCGLRTTKLPERRTIKTGERTCSQMNWVQRATDRIAHCNALLGSSRLCMQAAEGSMVSIRTTLANSMARISTSKELIARSDDRLQSYGALGPLWNPRA